MEASKLLRFRTMKTGFGEFSPPNSNPRQFPGNRLFSRAPEYSAYSR